VLTLKPRTIAIDGPAASGKTTVGDLLAEQLGYLHFDTGAMYRAVTWAALDRGIPVDDEARVTLLAQQLRIDVLPAAADDGRKYTVLADGTDVTWAIRTSAVDAGVSVVSAYEGVRTALVRQQRRAASARPMVMVGRDIATVVLPFADIKVYLDATLEERARRRWRELRARGMPAGYDEVVTAMRRRDDIDSHRRVSPLRVAEDAVVIDTTNLSPEAVADRIRALVEECGCPLV
jgi:cytidylate kinase